MSISTISYILNYFSLKNNIKITTAVETVVRFWEGGNPRYHSGANLFMLDTPLMK